MTSIFTPTGDFAAMDEDANKQFDQEMTTSKAGEPIDIMKCSEAGCKTKEDDDTLICVKCKKHIHYQCADLPAYQIYKFTELGYSSYECEQCVVIPTKMQELLNKRIMLNRSDRRTAEIESLKAELRRQKKIIYELNEHALTLETDKSSQNKKRRYGSIGEEMNVVLIEESANKGIEIQTLKNEIELMKEKYVGKHAMVEKSTETETDQDGRSSNANSKMVDDIVNLFNTRFETIEKNLSIIINDKLEKKIDKNTNNTSYADALAKNINKDLIGNVVVAAKNTEKVQNQERLRRENNIIIYGVEEGESDEAYIDGFLDVIGASVKPRSISRLGKPDDNKKSRPIKLVMQSTDEKSQIMSRLVNLKNADKKFQSASVRDDYSIEERKLIKEWVEDASARNRAENTDEYRVRGSPKNGLRIVRVTKKVTKETETSPSNQLSKH